MVLPAFSKDYSDPFSRAFREGRSPDENNQLGPYASRPNPKDFAASFAGQFKENPSKLAFWQQAFSQDTANQSQEKINLGSQSDLPSFKDPNDNQLAQDFLTKYSGPGGAIDRGLIAPEDAISKESLASLASQPAAARMNTTSKDTAGKFPNQGVQVG